VLIMSSSPHHQERTARILYSTLPPLGTDCRDGRACLSKCPALPTTILGDVSDS
jgi:hypothetical protein